MAKIDTPFFDQKSWKKPISFEAAHTNIADTRGFLPWEIAEEFHDLKSVHPYSSFWGGTLNSLHHIKFQLKQNVSRKFQMKKQ